MDARVVELHCIMPIANMASVASRGLLSYERAAALQHQSVALQPVQDRRDQIQVPGGLRLHQYANMYFHARNPMMYRRLNEASSLCVLRISTDALLVDGAVITDQNAASDYVRFLAPSQHGLLDFDGIFARDWRDTDRIAYWQKKSKKCAEVLVPHSVPRALIQGAYVVDANAASRLAGLQSGLQVTISPDLFFR